jgi:HEAT repeat protein
MNPSFRSGLLAGLIGGAFLMAVATFILRPRAAPAASVPPSVLASLTQEQNRLAEENRKLREQIAALGAPRPAPSAPVRQEDPAPAQKPAGPEVQDLFAKLAELGLGAFQSPQFGKTLEAVKAAGTPAIEFLAKVLRTSTSATERFVAAALLEGAADPAAVESLALALKGDKDDIVRRMASHALAVMGAPAAEAPLRSATVDDSDWGVRVNSAYGLAKLQKEDGLRLLRESYESPETPPEYRLPILGGLADVAAPSTAPLFRRILADTKDASYLLLSINALQKMKDTESIPALQQVANSTQPEMVKQAAAKAVDAIRK